MSGGGSTMTEGGILGVMILYGIGVSFWLWLLAVVLFINKRQLISIQKLSWLTCFVLTALLFIDHRSKRPLVDVLVLVFFCFLLFLRIFFCFLLFLLISCLFCVFFFFFPFCFFLILCKKICLFFFCLFCFFLFLFISVVFFFLFFSVSFCSVKLTPYRYGQLILNIVSGSRFRTRIPLSTNHYHGNMEKHFGFRVFSQPKMWILMEDKGILDV